MKQYRGREKRHIAYKLYERRNRILLVVMNRLCCLTTVLAIITSILFSNKLCPPCWYNSFVFIISTKTRKSP